MYSSQAPPQRCFSSFSPSLVLYSSNLLPLSLSLPLSLPSPLASACLSQCRAARREDTLMLSLLGWHNSTSLWGVKALTLPCLSVRLPARLRASPLLGTSQTFPACQLVLLLRLPLSPAASYPTSCRGEWSCDKWVCLGQPLCRSAGAGGLVAGRRPAGEDSLRWGRTVF